MYPGVHWIRDSLTHLLLKLYAVVTLRIYAVMCDELLHSSQSESLLKSSNNVIQVDSEGDNLDGSSIIFDSKQQQKL